MVKLLCILPKYEIEDKSNYQAVFDMLKIVADKSDVCLLIENPTSEVPQGQFSKIFVQRIKFPILNLVERLIIVFYVRLLGYKRVFVYYSYWGAMVASIAKLFTGGKVFFWHCYWINNKTDWPLGLTLKMVDYLVTGTKAAAKLYSEAFHLSRQKVKILPSWVDIQRFSVNKSKNIFRQKLKLPKKKNIILFFPRITISKGAEIWPEIISQVTAKVKDAYFLIVGKGDMTEWFRDEISKRKLGEFVKIMGPLPNTLMPQVFTACDLYILPSKGEGFPRPIIESMTAGTPFVTSGIGGTAEILTPLQKKYMVMTNNPGDYAQKAIDILLNKSTREQLIENGKKQVKKYSLENGAKTFVKLMAE